MTSAECLLRKEGRYSFFSLCLSSSLQCFLARRMASKLSCGLAGGGVVCLLLLALAAECAWAMEGTREGGFMMLGEDDDFEKITSRGQWLMLLCSPFSCTLWLTSCRSDVKATV